MLRAFSAYSGVSLKASYSIGGGGGGGSDAPCTDCEKLSGSLSGRGANVYVPEAGISVNAGVQQYWLRGPAGTDFDLHLYKKNSNGTWSEVASAIGSTSTEVISYNGAVGEYRMRVVSYSGSGNYDLYRKKP